MIKDTEQSRSKGAVTRTPLIPKGKNPPATRLRDVPSHREAMTKKRRTVRLVMLRPLLTLADISAPDANSRVSKRQMAAARRSILGRPGQGDGRGGGGITEYVADQSERLPTHCRLCLERFYLY